MHRISFIFSYLQRKRWAVTLAFFHHKPWIISVKVCTLNLNITGPLWLAAAWNTYMVCMSRWADKSLGHWAPQVICSAASPPPHRDCQRHGFVAKCLMEDLEQGNTQLPTWSLIWNLNPVSGSRHHTWKCKLPGRELIPELMDTTGISPSLLPAIWGMYLLSSYWAHDSSLCHHCHPLQRNPATS